MSEKYVVLAKNKPLDEGTYFVIKSSDLFAVPALWGYAHLLQTALELDNQRHMFTLDERESLDRLAELVASKADEWQTRGEGTVPD